MSNDDDDTNKPSNDMIDKALEVESASGDAPLVDPKAVSATDMVVVELGEHKTSRINVNDVDVQPEAAEGPQQPTKLSRKDTRLADFMSSTSIEELEKIAEQSTGCAGCFLNNLLDHAWWWWWCYLIANTLWLGLMLFLTFNGDTRDDQEWFWIGFGIKTFVLTIIQLVAGWGAQKHGWKVGYTRKCVHVGFFLLPQLLDVILPMPEDDTWLWGLWNVHLISWMLFLITRPIRTKFDFIETMYAAVDRPEDHGLTMLYTFLQVPLTIIVIGGFSIMFKYWVDREAWILAPIIAVTFGDGLAEPVAVFWKEHKVCGGTHTYKTSAICAGDKQFTRSFEGSACVMVFTVIGILIIFNDLSTVELVVNLLVMPITMALLEAVAPHSMDNPFLLTWGCLVMMGAHGIDIWSEDW